MRRARLAAALAAGAAAAALVAALPGCTRDPGEVVRLMIWGSPDEVKTVNSYLAAFREAHPEVTVQVEHTPDMGYRQKIQTLVRGANLPDVFYVNEADVPWMVRDGALLDLAPYVERDRAEVRPDDFYRETWECFEVGGGLYGICKDFATLVCYYNKDLFDKWDVPYPKAGWTWEEFLETARRTTREGDWGFLFETWAEVLFPWIWQAGAEVATNDPPRWLMGAPEHVDASAEGLQLLSDMIWEHRVSPPPSVTRDQGGSSLFQLGHVAMCTYGRWKHMDFKHITTFEWDVVELPRHRRQATTTFAVAYGVAANTPHPDKAWTLVKFLTSPESQRLVAHSGQAIPSRISVATSEAFMTPRALVERGLTADGRPHIEQVPFGRFTPRFEAAPECKTRFTQGVEPLWNGTRRDARALLLELQPAIEAIAAASRR
ncbi:MAG: sugar ABC transporter substrate-binding protein [Planctomycetes bacterium]|nr:sugar ABC transporter substrate-binding protein [Planctomycetota bacterium]